jgi:hypothetical protein
MRRPFVTLILLACFQFLSPAPAHAQFWRWIDELSGPGSFNGVVLPWRLVCIGGQPPPPTLTTERRVQYVTSAVLGGSGCLLNPGALPRASLNFDTGFLWAHRNDLDYASSVKKTVHMAILEPTFTFHIDPTLDNDWLEVGGGAGVLVMHGPAFDTFTRAFVEPIRGDFRPFANRGRWLRGIVVRGAVIIVPQGFDATDFGAKPGTFHSSSEVLPSIGAFFDWVQLLR